MTTKAIFFVKLLLVFIRYVVARGIDSGNITVWNIARGRCKGEAVSIERGLLEKNDVIVVKDVIVVVLSDRGITSAEHGSYQVIRTSCSITSRSTISNLPAMSPSTFNCRVLQGNPWAFLVFSALNPVRATSD